MARGGLGVIKAYFGQNHVEAEVAAATNVVFQVQHFFPGGALDNWEDLEYLYRTEWNWLVLRSTERIQHTNENNTNTNTDADYNNTNTNTVVDLG